MGSCMGGRMGRRALEVKVKLLVLNTFCLSFLCLSTVTGNFMFTFMYSNVGRTLKSLLFKVNLYSVGQIPCVSLGLAVTPQASLDFKVLLWVLFRILFSWLARPALAVIVVSPSTKSSSLSTTTTTTTTPPPTTTTTTTILSAATAAALS